jgi:hypothetical protein
MGATITVLNGGQRMATTDRAFATVVHKELMRDWALSFNVTNRDNARQYAIDPNAQFIVEGQIYDTEKYKQSSGTDNATEVSASHVLARMNNYMIPAGYAFVGTIAALIQDILTQSGASAEFTVGTCASVSGSYSLGNTQPTDAFSAIAKLTALGVEPSYDNFTINVPVRWGADTGKVFKFGRDLCSLERTFDKTTTPTTQSYGIDIANLQRLPGGSADAFVTGDTVGIQDALIGDSIIGQRIISYEKCLDDPTQDKVTIGNFISDLSDTVTTMQVDISATTAVSGNSVQQGEQYSNVSIDHENGFMAISGNNLMRTLNNATDGFVIQQYYNSVWVTVWQADSTTGKTIAYNLAHSQKVEMGGTAGYTTWVSTNGGATWTQTGGMDVAGVNNASALSMQGYSNFKVIVGKGSDNTLGMFIIDTNISITPFLKFYYATDGSTCIQKTQAGDLCFVDKDEYEIGGSGDLHLGGAAGYADVIVHVTEGIITEWNS